MTSAAGSPWSWPPSPPASEAAMPSSRAAPAHGRPAWSTSSSRARSDTETSPSLTTGRVPSDPPQALPAPSAAVPARAPRLPRMLGAPLHRADRGFHHVGGDVRMTSILRAPRLAALVAIAVLGASASTVSFAESYRGLFLWAAHHGLSGRGQPSGLYKSTCSFPSA